ncbi:hypothetical protein MNBD_GAMMA07-2335 [hydrothermal vent metagenome]|uniref:Uncharacterized protein n=1 Tax=hydrothermal vent metagenome TaxID=652676 RepID=A0A3B0XMP7_9ZZZZ
MALIRYKKKPDQIITAVQLSLDTTGFDFQKWGAKQHCKQGDWLVNNKGSTYTIDQQVFAKNYQPLTPGTYIKTTPIWAEIAKQNGWIKTKEGKSHYNAGDYLVHNNEDGTDTYRINANKFEAMYEVDLT